MLSQIEAIERIDDVLESMHLPYTLVPTQRTDIESSILAGRYGLFLDVGTGKTVISTVFCLALASDFNVVIVPPILKHQWAKWLKSIGETDVFIYEGLGRTREMLNHKWVIMSHAIFRSDYSKFILPFYAGKEKILIVDEAQACKNAQSKLFKAVNGFVGRHDPVLLLTGTPTSKPTDTYAYMKLKTPDIYRSFGHWENLHVADRDFYGTITAYKEMQLLASNFAMKSVKRTKKEVFGDVIEPIYQPINYKLDKAHHKLYEQLAEEQLLLLESGQKIDATSAQRLRHALQQIVANWSAFSGKAEDISKVYEIIDQTIEEVDPMNQSKSKLVIWTYYQRTSGAVVDYLKDKFGDKAVAAAYGAVNSQKGIDAIMNDPECRILVAQPSSCGAGLELQHVCSENLFVEMSTSVIQIKQAIGRTDRKGQTTRPTMRFAIAEGTIQVKLFNDLLKNDELVTQVERNVSSLRNEIFGET